MTSVISSNRGIEEDRESDIDDMTDITEMMNQQYENNKYNKLVVTKEGEIDPSHLLITEGNNTKNINDIIEHFNIYSFFSI